MSQADDGMRTIQVRHLVNSEKIAAQRYLLLSIQWGIKEISNARRDREADHVPTRMAGGTLAKSMSCSWANLSTNPNSGQWTAISASILNAIPVHNMHVRNATLVGPYTVFWLMWRLLQPTHQAAYNHKSNQEYLPINNAPNLRLKILDLLAKKQMCHSGNDSHTSARNTADQHRDPPRAE